MRLISPHTGIAMFYGIAERVEEAWNEKLVPVCIIWHAESIYSAGSRDKPESPYLPNVLVGTVVY